MGVLPSWSVLGCPPHVAVHRYHPEGARQESDSCSWRVLQAALLTRSRGVRPIHVPSSSRVTNYGRGSKGTRLAQPDEFQRGPVDRMRTGMIPNVPPPKAHSLHEGALLVVRDLWVWTLLFSSAFHISSCFSPIQSSWGVLFRAQPHPCMLLNATVSSSAGA